MIADFMIVAGNFLENPVSTIFLVSLHLNDCIINRAPQLYVFSFHHMSMIALKGNVKFSAIAEYLTKLISGIGFLLIVFESTAGITGN
jgi:hypothetical protein